MGDIRVELVEEREIRRDCWYANTALFLRDGQLLLPMETSFSNPEGKGHLLILRSPDRLRSWTEELRIPCPPFEDAKGLRVYESYALASPVTGHVQELADGSLLALSGNMVNNLVRREQRYKPYIALVRRAAGLAELLGGRYDDDFAKLEIPNLAAQCGDTSAVYTGGFDGKVVEMPDGELVVPMSGRFSSDTVRVPYHAWEAYQFRAWLCVSRDRGRSWSYLSTIAAPDRSPLPPQAEGYTETDVVLTEGGALVAVSRTGGNPTGDGSTERYTHLACSVSRDGGVTWDQPRPIARFGVFPRLARMSNGVLACSSGRPGVFLLFSADGGERWSPPLVVTDHHARWGYCPSGYTSIGELEPGLLCLFYDDVISDGTDGGTGTVRNRVMMRLYRVGSGS